MNRRRWYLGMIAVGMVWSVVPLQEATAGQTTVVEGVPQTLTHQGRLVDDTGHPMSGEIELTYTLWDHPTEGDVIWQDVIDVDVDDGGHYAVELGDDDNPIDTDVVAGGEGWFGIAIDGDDELEPRISLTSVPYALAVDTAAVSAGVEDGAIGVEALAVDFHADAEHVEEATGQTLGGMSCLEGDVARYDGDGWSCVDPTGGYVSEVTATAPVDSTGGQQPDISMTQADGSTDGYLSAEDFASFDSRLEDDDPRLDGPRQALPGSDDYIQNQTSADQNASFRIDGDAYVGGDVGVGTADPAADLHVAGDVQIDGDIDIDRIDLGDGIDMQGSDIRNMGTNTVNPLTEPLRVWAFVGGWDTEIESHQGFLEYQNARELLQDGTVINHHITVPNIDGGEGGPDDDWDIAALSCRDQHIDDSDEDYNPESLCNLWDTSAEFYTTYFRGALFAPESGTYTFATDSDDASELLINGEPAATWYGNHSDCDCWDNNGEIDLERGWHLFEYRQMERGGGDDWAAGWQKPSDSEIRHIPLSAFSTLSSPEGEGM